MTKNVTIAVLAAALVVALVILIPKIQGPTEPPPTPTPVPKEVTCEYRTISFTWDQLKTGGFAFVANPAELDDVQDCAEVIFVNQSDQSLTIDFGDASPFTGIHKIALEASGENAEYAKSLPVDTVLQGEESFDFPYDVAPDGWSEQSPRIRVGPKNTSQ